MHFELKNNLFFEINIYLAKNVNFKKSLPITHNDPNEILLLLFKHFLCNATFTKRICEI